MKIFVACFGLAVAAALSGCVSAPYYDAYQQYPYQAAPPPQAQYAPQQVAPVGCIPPYVPSWNGCALPMYRPQYFAPMYTGGYYGAPLVYTDPFLSFRFNFNFGKGGKHHGGGRHHRGR